MLDFDTDSFAILGLLPQMSRYRQMPLRQHSYILI